MKALSITEASRAGISKLASLAEEGTPVALSRHGRNVAALVSADEIAQLRADQNTLRDVVLLMTRLATDTGARTELSQAMEHFGIQREELEAEIDAGLHGL